MTGADSAAVVADAPDGATVARTNADGTGRAAAQ